MDVATIVHELLVVLCLGKNERKKMFKLEKTLNRSLVENLLLQFFTFIS